MTRTASTITLTSQTWWVIPGAVMTVRLAVSSPLPAGRLGLSVDLYPRLRSRFAFDQPLAADGPPEVVPDVPNTLPLAGLRTTGRANGVVQLSFDVASGTAPVDTRGLDRLVPDCAGGICGGVYPLQIQLLDTFEDTPLASVVTDLVYCAGGGTSPLELGLVVPIGNTPSLGPSGDDLLSRGQLQSLGDLVSVLRDHHEDGLSLALYPELLVALSRTPGPMAAGLLADLRSLIRANRAFEPLGSPFAPIDASALAEAGLSSELGTELSAAASTELGALGEQFPTSPYVSFDPLTGAGLSALSAVCPSELVLPDTGVLIAENETPTSPFVLQSPRWDCPPSARPHVGGGAQAPGGPVTLVSDAGLDAYFGDPDPDPVLLAHRFLAEISQIFFQDPYAAQPRGVVVAPGGVTQAAPRLLSAILEGLVGSPVVRATTLSSLFSSLPVGANAGPVLGALSSERTVPTDLSAAPVRNATDELRTVVASILPTDRAERTLLGDEVLTSMSVGLSRQQRAAYTGAVNAEVARLGHSLAMLGSPTVTLTARTAKLPLTIRYDGPRPAHVLLRLRSSELAFPGGVDHHLVLAARDNPDSVRVSAPTSGAFHLTIELVAPQGSVVLLEGRYTVRSTAVSGVAIALSIAALAVLVAWWWRSLLRSRRRRSAARAAPAS